MALKSLNLHKVGGGNISALRGYFPIIYWALQESQNGSASITAWYQCTLTQSSFTTAVAEASLGGCPSCGLSRSVLHKAEVRISVSHCKVSHLSLNSLPCLPRKHFQHAAGLSCCPLPGCVSPEWEVVLVPLFPAGYFIPGGCTALHTWLCPRAVSQRVPELLLSWAGTGRARLEPLLAEGSQA